MLAGVRRAWTMRHGHQGALLAVIAVAVLCHGLSLWGQFCGDDAHTILRHPAIGKGGGVIALFTHDVGGNPLGTGTSIYRPFTGLTYLQDYRLGGGHPLPFHITNLGVFVGLCVLVLHVARRWLRPSGALVAALLFAALPNHVEAVANATGRSDVLSLLFGLLALELALPPPEGTAGRTWARATGAALCYMLALLSKEASFLYPLIVLWLALCAGRRRARDFAGAAAMALVTIAYLLFRSRYMLTSSGLAQIGKYDLNIYNPLGDPQVRPFARLWTALEAFGRYVINTYVPYDMSIDYSFAASYAHADLGAPLAWAGLAVVCACAFACGRALLGIVRGGVPEGAMRAGALLGAFIASYVLIANIGLHIGVLVAYRLFFGPSVWLALLFGLGWEHGARHVRPVVLRGALGGVLACYFAACLVQIPCWHDPEARSMCAFASQPRSHNAQLWMAKVYQHRRQPYPALWFAALRYATLRHYPHPWAPRPEVNDLPYDVRVARLHELLEITLPPELFYRELETVLLRELNAPELAGLLRTLHPPAPSPPASAPAP